MTTAPDPSDGTPTPTPISTSTPRVVSISVTEAGRQMARRLPYPTVHGGAGDAIRTLWSEVDALVLFLATGAAVRLVAPLLAGKDRDPAVVSVDEAGRYAIALLGGHSAQANALAGEVAALVGATAVVTTATDAAGVVSVEEVPGFTVHGDVAGLSLALLDGTGVDVVRRVPWPLPEALLRAAGPSPSHQKGRGFTLVIDDHACPSCPPLPPLPDDHATEIGSEPKTSSPAASSSAYEPHIEADPAGPASRKVAVAHPPSLVIGVGCSSTASAPDAHQAVTMALAAGGMAAASVTEIATIDRRRSHPAITALQVPIRSFDAATLASVDVPHPSAQVRAAVGTPSVAEAAALLAAGVGGELVVAKQTTPMATAAVSRRLRPTAQVAVVGLGPGDVSLRTPAATAVVRHADSVVGYGPYVDQCADLLRPHQNVVRSPIGAEIQRAQLALDLAATGQSVALVCSGDAGVFAMASPLLELAAAPPYAHVDIVGVAGVTAAHAAAAVLGAPLGHDHALVSLSDLLTPWDVIERRVAAVAAGDLAIAFYNPRSARRHWQLERARQVLLTHRSPGTPVGIVTDAGRPSQHVVLDTLAGFDADAVTMTSCVVVGSSTTVVAGGRMVTPRGYQGSSRR